VISVSFVYTFKRLIRSWRLFIALLLGIVLASTFFAGINVGADTAARQALDQELGKVFVDVYITPSFDYMTGRRSQSLSSKNITDAINAISKVEGVTKAEAIFSGMSGSIAIPDKNLSRPSFRLVGISEDSRINDGWIGGAHTIRENETYVWSGSADAGLFKAGDVIPLNLTIGQSYYSQGNGTTYSFLLNLTVAGTVQLTDQALALATGQYYSGDLTTFKQYFSDNLLIVSWAKTLTRMLDYAYNSKPENSFLDTTIYAYLSRETLISPWDTSGSLSKLRTVTFQINAAVSEYSMQATNQLENTLSSYQGGAFLMLLTFIIAALPVFFVAWYMGSTVSDVSFNLRRQEIGLLLTKGFSRRQLFSTFLFEAVLIGLAGGLLGLLLSLALSPLFITVVGGQFTGVPVIGLETIFLTVAFAVIITFLSAYRPARRASNVATVEALRKYVYVEEVKPYRRFWPWFALILGSFKMGVFLLGINFQAEMMKLSGAPANILVFFFLGLLVFLDTILTYIGPFLFFWGFTKIFILGSLKFQAVTTRAARFLGDLGELATKSVQRNPARAAAVAFLIAFIIGYSVQIVGTLASEQDFGIRQTRFAVGADIGVDLKSPLNATKIMDAIRNNVTQVDSLTVEYTIWGSAGLQTYQSMQLRAVDAKTWPSTAYHEDDLFSGSSVAKAFESLASNNHTIILDRNYARALDKKMDDTVAITVGGQTTDLTVVGFFGTESQQLQVSVPLGQPSQYYYLQSQYWSYLPEGLYKELSAATGLASTAKILIKLKSGSDSETVAQQIRQLGNIRNDIGSVSSVGQQLREQQSNYTVTGSLNILRLGVIFMVIAASVGTALITFVSLGERRREASIMSVRGLSFKQLVVMLLTENLAVVVFSVLLGAIVGLIVVRGTIASSNALNFLSSTPLNRHMVFPPDALLMLFASFSLVFASTIIPVILMARIFSSRLERTVREV
jgi:ABC-type antimicrobial peptide transport system permease subunit